MNVRKKLEMRSLAIFEIIAIGVLVGACESNLGEEEVVGGREWYHSKQRW